MDCSSKRGVSRGGVGVNIEVGLWAVGIVVGVGVVLEVVVGVGH